MPEAKKGAKSSRFPWLFAGALSLLFPTLYALRSFDLMEGFWQDAMYTWNAGSIPTGDPRIIIAAIDTDTVDDLGWPFPRDEHAKIIRRLVSLGVKVIVFDVHFIEPDKRHPETDRALIGATREAKRVIHLGLLHALDEEGKAATWESPIQGLKEASAFIGFPNVEGGIDVDGHLRRIQLFSSIPWGLGDDSLPAPSMDLAAAALFLGKPLSQFNDSLEKPWLYFLNFRKPQEWVRHPYAAQARDKQVITQEPKLLSSYQQVCVRDLIKGHLTAEQKESLKGSVVYVGFNSTLLGAVDHYPSPYNPVQPGVEFHANALDNLLHGDFLEGIPIGWTILVILAMIWIPVALSRLPPAVGAGAAGAMLVAWVVFYNAQLLKQVRWEFMPPALALFVSYLVLTIHRVFTEGAEKRFIKNVFGQFVAPEVVDDLVKDPAKVKLGGEKRDMTVFFLDIAHFTTISEKMDAEALIVFLNKYLSALSAVIHQRKGVVDKYIGDCIMAFWNAPIEQQDHRALACLSAVECFEVLETLNKDLDPNLPERPAIRIGLNSGFMTVGLTGSQQKLQYTVIGDEVNLASRLEGANKFFGSRIMVSEGCFEGAKDSIEARELGRVRVVGKAVPIRVFELLGRKGGLADGWAKALPRYVEGIALYNKREFAGAKARFQEVMKLVPNDAVSKLYLNVCEDYIMIPPPAEWDGVFNLTAK